MPLESLLGGSAPAGRETGPGAGPKRQGFFTSLVPAAGMAPVRGVSGFIKLVLSGGMRLREPSLLVVGDSVPR